MTRGWTVRIARIAAVVTFVAGAAVAFAAVPPAPSVPPAKVGLREEVSIYLVQMPLIATDRQGRPVGDLKPEEIVAKLGRRPVRVAFLDPARRPRNAAAATDVRLFLDAPGGWSSPARQAATEPRYIALFIDVENDAPVLRAESVKAMAAFARTGLDPGDRACVFSYDGKLNLELPFTDDRAALESAVLAASARTGRPRTDPKLRARSLERSMEACVNSQDQFDKRADPQCLRDVANEYAGEANPRAQDFVQALDDLVRYLGGLEGRKTVVALTHGVPIESATVLLGAARAVFGESTDLNELQRYVGFGSPPRLAMDRLLEAAVRNRVSLNFIDRVAPPNDDFQASRGEMMAPGSFPSRIVYDAAVADVQQMASTSGGLRLASTDVGRGLDRIVALLDSGYDLGLDVGEPLGPKDLKKLDVSCTRKGVKLVRSAAVQSPKSAEEPVMRGRYLLMRPTPVASDPNGALHQPFRMELDPKAIGYRVAGDEATANFTVHLTVLSPTAGKLADTFHYVNHSYDAAVWTRGEAAPVIFSGWIEAPAGEYVLRAWVRNVDTGEEGALSSPVRITTERTAGTGH